MRIRANYLTFAFLSSVSVLTLGSVNSAQAQTELAGACYTGGSEAVEACRCLDDRGMFVSLERGGQAGVICGIYDENEAPRVALGSVQSAPGFPVAGVPQASRGVPTPLGIEAQPNGLSNPNTTGVPTVGSTGNPGSGNPNTPGNSPTETTALGNPGNEPGQHGPGREVGNAGEKFSNGDFNSTNDANANTGQGSEGQTSGASSAGETSTADSGSSNGAPGNSGNAPGQSN